MLVYVIKDWDKLYEKSESRKYKNINWVAFPNKHDGRGFRRLMKQSDGLAMFGAFVLIVEVASKMPKRGTLVDHDGIPISASDIADKTGADVSTIQKALQVLSHHTIGWILAENLPESPGAHPASPGTTEDSRYTEHNRHNRHNRQTDTAAADAAAERRQQTGTQQPCELAEASTDRAVKSAPGNPPCELDALAWTLASDLAAVHPVPGRPDAARAWLERHLSTAIDPLAVATALRKSHEAFRPYWASLRRDKPRAFIPHLVRWLQDGDWEHPPQMKAEEVW